MVDSDGVGRTGRTISGDANNKITWIRPDGTPFTPGERYTSACTHGVPMLDGALIPHHLRTPQSEPPELVNTS